MPRRFPPGEAFLDPSCPIEWDHPLNVGLAADWTVPPLPGWSGGLTLRGLTRGGRAPADGTLTNGPSWRGGAGRPGGYGSLFFDDLDDYVLISGDPAPLKITGTQITLAAWFRLNTLFTGTKQIIDKSGATTRYNLSKNGSGSTRIQFGAAGQFVETPDGLFGNNAWTHAVGTYDGAALTIYLNGHAVVTQAGSGAITDTTNPATVGGLTGGEAWDGLLDAIMVYGRCLSAGEVAALYAETARGNPERWRWVRPWAFAAPAGGGGGTAVTFDCGGPLEWLTGQRRDSVSNQEFLSGLQRDTPSGTDDTTGVSRDTGSTEEILTGIQRDTPSALELLTGIRSDTTSLTESLTGLQRDTTGPLEWLSSVQSDSGAPYEWTGAIGVTFDCSAGVEWKTGISRDVTGGDEFLTGVLRDTPSQTEWLIGVSVSYPFSQEFLSGVRASTPAPYEWTAPTPVAPPIVVCGQFILFDTILGTLQLTDAITKTFRVKDCC